MIVLWIAAALMSAACAGLIMRRAALARHAVGQALEDPALAVYRRQLTEVDDLAERGLIGAEDLRSAHAEAARRLLSAADVVRAGWGAQSGGGRVVLAVAVLTPLLRSALCRPRPDLAARRSDHPCPRPGRGGLAVRGGGAAE
jgi:cytochrome c-type biogenesis protein CcmH